MRFAWAQHFASIAGAAFAWAQHFASIARFDEPEKQDSSRFSNYRASARSQAIGDEALHPGETVPVAERCDSAGPESA
jgi:hypothetical protein